MRPISVPASAGTIVGSPNPKVTTRPNGEVMIEFQEMMRGVTTSATFSAVQVRCAPFSVPWMGGLAPNFSKWRWNYLQFIYIPGCATSVSGSIAMSLQFDVPDTAPSDLQNMSFMKGFVTVPYWAGVEGASCLNSYKRQCAGACLVNVDVNRSTKQWYPYIKATDFTTLITTDAPAGNIYVPSTLVVATTGGPETSVSAGAIYVKYSVTLIEPTSSGTNY